MIFNIKESIFNSDNIVIMIFNIMESIFNSDNIVIIYDIQYQGEYI